MIKNTFLTIFIYYCVVLKPNNINNLKNIIPRTYEFHEWCIKPPILMYRNNKMHLIYNNKCQQSQYSTYKQIPFIFLIISILIINTLFWMSSFNTNFKIISTILAATLKFPLLLSFYFIKYPHKLYFFCKRYIFLTFTIANTIISPVTILPQLPLTLFITM